MQKTIVDAQTGEIVTVNLTPEEIIEQEALAQTIQNEIEMYTPSQVPMWAVRTVLQNNGLFDKTQTLINSSTDNALKNIWEYGNFVDRSSTTINSLTVALNLTSEQVDQMFRDAGNLSV